MEKNILSAIKKVALFTELPDEEVAQIADQAEEHDLSAGEVLFNEGDPWDSLYFILSGELEIYRTGASGDKIHLATLGKGEYFGEMALLEDKPRSASARSISDCKLVSLDRDTFTGLLEVNSKIAIQLANTISSRLRLSNEAMVKASAPAPDDLLAEEEHPPPPAETPETQKLKVFISYAREDQKFVHDLVDGLESHGLETWVDWERIPLGEDWRNEIRLGIERAEIFIFVISPDSLQSKECRKELEIAVKHNKRMLPVLYREPPSGFDWNIDDLFTRIQAINWVYMRRDSNEFSQNLPKVIEIAHTDIEWVRAHTRLLRRAVEWEHRNRDDSFLLRGSGLSQAESFLSELKIEPRLTELQVVYIQAGQKYREAEFQRQKEISRQLADQVLQLRARELAALTIDAMDNDLDLALLLSVEAFNKGEVFEIPQTRTSLFSAWQHNPQLFKFLKTNSPEIWSVAFSPNGEILAAGGPEEICLWEVATGELLSELRTNREWINGMAFSPDGRILASGSTDNTVKLWQIETGNAIGNPFRGHTEPVNAIAFSPDGRMLASASYDDTVRVWQVENPETEPLVLRGHEKDVYGVDFSPEGLTLASGSDDGTIHLWDVARGALIKTFSGHTNRVWTVKFSPDGRMLGSTSDDHSVRVWDVTSGESIVVLKGHNAGVVGLDFSPDSKFLASGGWDNTVRLWDVKKGEQLGDPLRGFNFDVFSLAFSRDSSDGSFNLAVGGDNRSALLWKMNPDLNHITLTHRNLAKPLIGHAKTTSCLAFNPIEKKILASGGLDGTIRLWDVTTAEQIGPSLGGEGGPVYGISFGRDGKTLSSTSGSFRIQRWDVAARQPLGDPVPGERTFESGLAFSPDGQILALTRNNVIDLWDVATGEPIGQPLEGHAKYINTVAFSPDGRVLASGGWDDTVLLWDVETGERIGSPLKGHGGLVFGLAFGSIGDALAVGTNSQTIILWDIKTGEQIGNPLEGHSGYVFAIQFSPDNLYIATGSGDHTVRLWDFATGRPLGEPLRAHIGQVKSVAFSPDGLFIASGAEDGTIQLWPGPETWIKDNCARAGRNLTRSEWEQFFPDEEYRVTCRKWPPAYDFE